MVDFDYGSAGFLDWWAGVWGGYILGQGAVEDGVDGFRIDVSDASWWASGVWDRIAASARDGGHPVAVWGESSRYHFSQHDIIAPIANLTQHAEGAKALGRCLNTFQLSCHDSGWESAPGNYFFLRGSRAQFANAALHVYIPLWLGGDEYDEDPVIDLPLLKKDLYGTSNLPGGWMYGSQRDWSQLDDPSSRQSLMLADTTALLAVQRAHSDVLHRNACAADFASLAGAVSGAGAPLALDPYARFLPGAKAVLVLVNADTAAPASVVVAVPLAAMGFDAGGFFEVSVLYGAGAPAPQRVSGAALAALPVTIAADKTPGGGAYVVLIVPAAAAPPPAGAASARVTGPVEMVYDFYAEHCPSLPDPWCPLDISVGCDCDIADSPMRLFRRSGGDGRVFSVASVDLGSRAMVGADALNLEHMCSLYANSTKEQSFAASVRKVYPTGPRFPLTLALATRPSFADVRKLRMDS